MNSQLFELYYSDGGHGGPHADFFTAVEEAKLRIAGCQSISMIEIRPRTSAVRGGFKTANSESCYLAKTNVNWNLTSGSTKRPLPALDIQSLANQRPSSNLETETV
jgi:hypothetical protein